MRLKCPFWKLTMLSRLRNVTTNWTFTVGSHWLKCDCVFFFKACHEGIQLQRPAGETQHPHQQCGTYCKEPSVTITSIKLLKYLLIQWTDVSRFFQNFDNIIHEVEMFFSFLLSQHIQWKWIWCFNKRNAAVQNKKNKKALTKIKLSTRDIVYFLVA